MWNTLGAFKSFEDELNSPTASAETLNSRWFTVVQNLDQLFNNPSYSINWIGVTSGSRPVWFADATDVMSKVGLDFNLSALMIAYQTRINNRNIQYTLETSVSQPGSSPYTIPQIFLP
jgi:hypothetical protein